MIFTKSSWFFYPTLRECVKWRQLEKTTCFSSPKMFPPEIEPVQPGHELPLLCSSRPPKTNAKQVSCGGHGSGKICLSKSMYVNFCDDTGTKLLNTAIKKDLINRRLNLHLIAKNLKSSLKQDCNIGQSDKPSSMNLNIFRRWIFE